MKVYTYSFYGRDDREAQVAWVTPYVMRVLVIWDESYRCFVEANTREQKLKLLENILRVIETRRYAPMHAKPASEKTANIRECDVCGLCDTHYSPYGVIEAVFCPDEQDLFNCEQSIRKSIQALG